METGILYVALCLIEVLSFVSTDGDIRCNYDEFVVEDVVGKQYCIPCKKCPLGMGLSPQCASQTIHYGTKIECKPCIEGKTFSSSFSIESCQPCGICSDHQDVLEKCNVTHNSRCAKSCDTGFYLSPVVGDCQKCSWCCSDSSPSSHEKQCKKSGVPFYKQCTIGEAIRCQPNCTNEQYVFVSETLNKVCLECPNCGIGQGLYPRCQSILTSPNVPKCYNCIPGKTFSDSIDTLSCKQCKVCGVGKKIERNCTISHDTLCGDCNPGFYKEETKCKHCSFCCGDELDTIVHECREQGMPKEKQCSYTTRSITECPPKKSKKDKNNIVFITVSFLAIILIVVIITRCYFKRKNRGKKYDSLNNEDEMKGNQDSDDMDIIVPSSSSLPKIKEFDDSGVRVECQDANLLESLSVESCWDEHEHLPNKQYLYLSPLTRFHCDRNINGKEIKLDIPHSAYKEEVNNTWKIKVLKQTSSGKDGGPIELTELYDPGMTIGYCSVKFTVTELAAFIIVGVPDDPKYAKKRMHIGVFGGEPNIDHPYVMNIYLFDDCESFLQKLKLQEERKGHLQLSLKCIYPDVNNSNEIFVDIKNKVNGWTGQLSREVIQSFEWRNSYRRTPMIEATFKNTDPHIRDFKATFEFKFNDTTILVPVAYKCSEPDIPIGIQPSDYKPQTPTGDVSIGVTEQGESSLNSFTCVSHLTPEVTTKWCMKIDQTLDKQKVEALAIKHHSSILPEEIEEIRNSDQPFTSFITMLNRKGYLFTKDEFFSILKGEGLNIDDFMSNLSVDNDCGKE